MSFRDDSRGLVYRLYEQLEKARHKVGAERTAALGRVLGQVRSALDRHQSRAVLWYLLGLTLDGLGRSEAVAAFLESRRRGARGLLASGISFHLAVLYVKMHRCDLALKEYERSLTSTTSDRSRALVASNAAECEMALGRLSRAVRGYRRALRLDPDSKSARWGLAVALDRQGRFDEAVVVARSALSSDPRMMSLVGPAVFFEPPVEVEYYLAMAALAGGDGTRAAVHWKKYLDGFPESLWRLRAQQHLARLGYKPAGWRIVISVGKGAAVDAGAVEPVRRSIQSSVRRCVAVGRPDPRAEMRLVFDFVLNREGSMQLASVWPRGPWVDCLVREIGAPKSMDRDLSGRTLVFNVSLLVNWEAPGSRGASGRWQAPPHSRRGPGPGRPGWSGGNRD